MDTPSEECFADVLLALPADAQGLTALRARLLPAADTAAPPKDVVAPLFPRLAYLVRHAADGGGGDGPAGAFVTQWARRVGGGPDSVACLETMWTAAQRLAAAAAGGVDEARAAEEERGAEATAASGLEDLLDLALQKPSRALRLIGAYARRPVFRAFIGSEAAGEEVRTSAALVFATRLLSLSTDGARARLLAQVWEAGVSPAMTGLTASFFLNCGGQAGARLLGLMMRYGGGGAAGAKLPPPAAATAAGEQLDGVLDTLRTSSREVYWLLLRAWVVSGIAPLQATRRCLGFPPSGGRGDGGKSREDECCELLSAGAATRRALGQLASRCPNGRWTLLERCSDRVLGMKLQVAACVQSSGRDTNQSPEYLRRLATQFLSEGAAAGGSATRQTRAVCCVYALICVVMMSETTSEDGRLVLEAISHPNAALLAVVLTVFAHDREKRKFFDAGSLIFHLTGVQTEQEAWASPGSLVGEGGMRTLRTALPLADVCGKPPPPPPPPPRSPSSRRLRPTHRCVSSSSRSSWLALSTLRCTVALCCCRRFNRRWGATWYALPPPRPAVHTYLLKQTNKQNKQVVCAAASRRDSDAVLDTMFEWVWTHVLQLGPEALTPFCCTLALETITHLRRPYFPLPAESLRRMICNSVVSHCRGLLSVDEGTEPSLTPPPPSSPSPSAAAAAPAAPRPPRPSTYRPPCLRFLERAAALPAALALEGLCDPAVRYANHAEIHEALLQSPLQALSELLQSGSEDGEGAAVSALEGDASAAFATQAGQQHRLHRQRYGALPEHLRGLLSTALPHTCLHSIARLDRPSVLAAAATAAASGGSGGGGGGARSGALLAQLVRKGGGPSRRGKKRCADGSAVETRRLAEHVVRHYDASAGERHDGAAAAFHPPHAAMETTCAAVVSAALAGREHEALDAAAAWRDACVTVPEVAFSAMLRQLAEGAFSVGGSRGCRSARGGARGGAKNSPSAGLPFLLSGAASDHGVLSTVFAPEMLFDNVPDCLYKIPTLCGVFLDVVAYYVAGMSGTGGPSFATQQLSIVAKRILDGAALVPPEQQAILRRIDRIVALAASGGGGGVAAALVAFEVPAGRLAAALPTRDTVQAACWRLLAPRTSLGGRCGALRVLLACSAADEAGTAAALPFALSLMLPVVAGWAAQAAEGPEASAERALLAELFRSEPRMLETLRGASGVVQRAVAQLRDLATKPGAQCELSAAVAAVLLVYDTCPVSGVAA